MATRKDLLKAQSFTTRRMIAAFVDRDPDDPTPPLRRVGIATFVSVLLGVVLLAGVALIGLLGGGVSDDSWKQENQVIVDSRSGSLFVWDGEALRPMADITTALLVAAPTEGVTGPAPIVRVKTEALRNEEQKAMLGIPGAPRQLPEADELEGYPVRFCSSERTGRGRFLTVEFGSTATVDWSSEIVVETGNGAQFLIADGKSHLLWSQPGEASPLSADLPVIVDPGASWIAALPQGSPFQGLDIPQMGVNPLDNPLQLTIGQFVRVPATDAAPARYYVQLNEGLSRVAYLDVVLQVHRFPDQYPEMEDIREISDSVRLDMEIESREQHSLEDLPLDQPRGPEGLGERLDQSVCMTFTDDRPGEVGISVGQPTPTIPGGGTTPLGRIDYLDMGALGGALFRNVDAAADDSAVTLVVGGEAFPIADANARAALGYGEATALSVTPQFLAILPSGFEGGGMSLGRDSVVAVDQ